jgi:hypothetical protein
VAWRHCGPTHDTRQGDEEKHSTLHARSSGNEVDSDGVDDDDGGGDNADHDDDDYVDEDDEDDDDGCGDDSDRDRNDTSADKQLAVEELHQ